MQSLFFIAIHRLHNNNTIHFKISMKHFQNEKWKRKEVIKKATDTFSYIWEKVKIENEHHIARKKRKIDAFEEKNSLFSLYMYCCIIQRFSLLQSMNSCIFFNENRLRIERKEFVEINLSIWFQELFHLNIYIELDYW